MAFHFVANKKSQEWMEEKQHDCAFVAAAISFFHHGNTQISQLLCFKSERRRKKELKPDKLAMGFRRFQLYSF